MNIVMVLSFVNICHSFLVIVLVVNEFALRMLLLYTVNDGSHVAAKRHKTIAEKKRNNFC